MNTWLTKKDNRTLESQCRKLEKTAEILADMDYDNCLWIRNAMNKVIEAKRLLAEGLSMSPAQQQSKGQEDAN